MEAYRLLKARWNDFSPRNRRIIEQRLCGGPPRDWFYEGAEIDRHIDRCRFDVLGQMEQGGFQLSVETRATLKGIRERWPQWILRPEELTGFHTWSSSGHGVVGDPPPASVHALQQALTRIQAADPKLADTRQFQKLRNYAAA